MCYAVTSLNAEIYKHLVYFLWGGRFVRRVPSSLGGSQGSAIGWKPTNNNVTTVARGLTASALLG